MGMSDRPPLLALAGLSVLLAASGAGQSAAYKGPDNVVFAGVRSSVYGIRPFPGPEGWKNALWAMKNNYPEATVPCAIWIVAARANNRDCLIEFPGSDRKYKNVLFSAADRHEPYLDFFDRNGIKVFLQVEPMDADVPTLIDLVLNRYGRHPAVIGFGIDIEWYRWSDYPGRGMKVDDEKAESWERAVKAHNPDYRLFLKHWHANWMPRRYRGDIAFVDDCQILYNLKGMVSAFSKWAERFAPNPVFFQVGYARDRTWWKKLADPPRDIGRAVAARISQPCGIFWVDFTLREVFPGI